MDLFNLTKNKMFDNMRSILNEDKFKLNSDLHEIKEKYHYILS